MEIEDGLMLNTLVNRYHASAPNALLKFLSKEDLHYLQGLPIPQSDPTALFGEFKDLIQHVHYSWLAPIIQKQSKDLQPFLLAILPKEFGSSLGKLLQIPPLKISPSNAVQNFFIHHLCSSVFDKNILPRAFLPSSPLNALLSLPKQHLVQLIDFLGLYDLAAELKTIIDKEILNTVSSILSKEKQAFLKLCMKKSDPFRSPKLGIQNWNEASKNLETLLHRRGLIRLSKALSREHPSLIWHVSHFLDVGRGSVILQTVTSQEAPPITSALISQVTHLISLLTKKPSGDKS